MAGGQEAGSQQRPIQGTGIFQKSSEAIRFCFSFIADHQHATQDLLLGVRTEIQFRSKRFNYFDIFKTCFTEKAIFLTTLFNVHVTNDNQIEKVRVVFALTQSSRS